jgi:hypothetical protein
MTRMVMDVTVRDENGDSVFSRQQEFSVSDLYFKAATEHFDFGLKSLESAAYSYIVPVGTATKSADIAVTVSYIYSSEKTVTVDKVSSTVTME